MMKRFVDFDWLMELYDVNDLPEEVRNYGVPMAVIQQNIADAPYITLREDETAEFEILDSFGNWKKIRCSKCHKEPWDIGVSECPYCGRKIVRFDK